MKPIITIGITSYKRINELIRCINSIQTKFIEDIEILISEDKSPLSNEIKDAVETIATASKYNIKFTTNEENLGYDKNLGAIIQKSSGDYIFFMSDDDSICEDYLDVIIPIIKETKSYGVFYSPFIYSDSNEKDRNHNVDFVVPAGLVSAKKYIYDSILFSGLIFKKEYVKNIDASAFKNKNYFQVYLFLTMLYKYGGYYCATPSVLCIGDGENAYGSVKSSGGDFNLVNRKNVKSNLAFNKTLIEVIRMFDVDNTTDVIDSFSKQYSIHSYSGLSIARRSGIKFFNEYWKMLNSLNIKLSFITKCYYLSLLIFGSKLSDKLLSKIRMHLKNRL